LETDVSAFFAGHVLDNFVLDGFEDVGAGGGAGTADVSADFDWEGAGQRVSYLV